ncbi:MAG: hypothetical protein ACI920_003517, partial [Saprospiraceae bacterium]
MKGKKSTTGNISIWCKQCKERGKNKLMFLGNFYGLIFFVMPTEMEESKCSIPP